MKISILGTGALGIALAKVISETKDVQIVMWTKFEEEKDLVKSTRQNAKLIPGVVLEDSIDITTDLSYAIEDSTFIINCLPFVAIRDVAKSLKDIYKGQYICSTTKGIDLNSLEVTTQIFEEELNTDKVCALSGPSFAIEIANYDTISFVLAGKNTEAVDAIYNILSNDSNVIDKSDDPIGVQLCGAIKNAIAIGSGMLYGMNAADSTKAAYLARGIKDMITVITSLNGSRDTINTYAGIGDLILTCMSEKSRNFSCGKLIGEGYSLDEAIEKLDGKTVEGIKVIEALNTYVVKNNLDTDVIPKLYDIVFCNKSIDTIKKV